MAPQASSETRERPRILVQGHRGYSERYPENTLLSMERAFAVGADRVEIDLGLTADEQVVIIHDATVDRTTNGQGEVATLTLSQVDELDAGSWKAHEFAGSRIPTLDEALELSERRGELNIEIKCRNRDTALVARTALLGVRTVKRHDAVRRVIFSSFCLGPLRLARQECPAVRLLLIDWDEPGTGSGLQSAIEERFFGWAPKAVYATSERIRAAKAAGLHVQIGAAEIGPRLFEWIGDGADAFSADNPEELVAFLGKDQEM
ncbi:MAG: glycerophosphodiester phosphodiesterase family protein [Trueperaceae bacterium]